MATPPASVVSVILETIGLTALQENFKRQRVTDVEMCKQLSDQELSSLGLTTIGDRARFRAELQHEQPAASTSRADDIPRPRQFQPSRSRYRFDSRKKGSRKKTWTSTLMCLSDTNQANVPTHAEKVCLQKAGLGLKKITFDAFASESDVHSTLVNEYPKLADCGGYELMYCSANRRELKKIDVKWDVAHLKTVVGGQSRIYIRPIQICLSLESEDREVEEQCNLTYPCKTCGNDFNVNTLREHIGQCMLNNTEATAATVEETRQNANEVFTDSTSEATLSMPSYEIDSELRNDFTTEIHYVFQSDLSVGSNNFLEPSSDTVSVDTVEKSDIQQVTKDCIEDLASLNISDPIHGLKYIQAKIVTGRKLDFEEEDITTGLTGDTNYIIVDRHNILSTGMDEISGLQNLRLTLEVQFYGESAEDYGGPRKEFFGLILPEMKSKYFEPVRDWVNATEYETTGKIIVLSMLQNGKLPRILDVETLDELFGDSPRDVLAAVGKGMDSLGIFQILKAHSFMRHLLNPATDQPLTLKMTMHLLQPTFSPEGSNKRAVESALYQKFIKYLRELAGGRREGINLGMVLKFVTGVETEPPLGFGIPPSVIFVNNVSVLPTANTCSNRLTLAVPPDNILPDDETLFKLYDYAFCNSYFGLA